MMFVIISLVLELQRLNLKFSKSKRKKPIQFSFFGVLRLSEVFRLIWRILKFSKSDCRFGTVGSQRAKICVVQNFSWLLFCVLGFVFAQVVGMWMFCVSYKNYVLGRNQQETLRVISVRKGNVAIICSCAQSHQLTIYWPLTMVPNFF